MVTPGIAATSTTTKGGPEHVRTMSSSAIDSNQIHSIDGDGNVASGNSNEKRLQNDLPSLVDTNTSISRLKMATITTTKSQSELMQTHSDCSEDPKPDSWLTRFIITPACCVSFLLSLMIVNRTQTHSRNPSGSGNTSCGHSSPGHHHHSSSSSSFSSAVSPGSSTVSIFSPLLSPSRNRATTSTLTNTTTTLDEKSTAWKMLDQAFDMRQTVLFGMGTMVFFGLVLATWIALKIAGWR